MVGRRSFPFGKAYFQGFLLLVSGRIFSFLLFKGESELPLAIFHVAMNFGLFYLGSRLMVNRKPENVKPFFEMTLLKNLPAVLDLGDTSEKRELYKYLSPPELQKNHVRRGLPILGTN